MAAKLRLIRLMQQVRAHAQVTNRRPAPRPAMPYLMQLRERVAPARMPSRRLFVSTDAQAADHTPLPIKINHIREGELSLPMVIC
jgi:hypothetical protein